MTCRNPISIRVNREAFQFEYPEKFGGFYRTVSCGKCNYCRFMARMSYTVRCELEARMHESNCLLLLTYAPEHLPENGTLVKEDLQGFMKRLRSHLDYHESKKIRFFGAGEYGDDNGRPHYHVIIFGHDFPDKRKFKLSKKGYQLYRSETVEKLWKYGHVTVAEMSILTAKYVAKYLQKKVTGDAAAEHYKNRIPEFQHASLNPGIGEPWYQENKHWLWKDDQIVIVINGKRIEMRPPRYFERLFEKEDPEGYEQWKTEVKALRKNSYRTSGMEITTHLEDDEAQ